MYKNKWFTDVAAIAIAAAVQKLRHVSVLRKTMSNRPNPIAIQGRRRHHVVLLLAQLVPLFAVTDWVHGGVIAHWTFDVSASDAVGAHPGTLQGGAVISSDGGAIAGQALVLDGDGDYVSIPYSGEFELGAGTVSLWFRGGPSTDQRHFYTLVDLHHGTAHGTEGHGWVIMGDKTEDRISFGGHLVIVIFYGANALLGDGEWHHFVATFESAGNARLYVDGVFAASAPFPGFTFINETAALTIGRWGAAVDQGEPANARDYLGRIDDVQIYNRALGASEVSYLYDNPGTTLASIPTVSEWGLIVMGLLTITAGSVVVKRRRVADA